MGRIANQLYRRYDGPALPIQDQVLSSKHSTFHWQWLLARKNIGKK